MINRALVTGASSGIGEAFARRLAAEGTDLVVVARRADRLDTLAKDLVSAGVGIEVLAGDLTTEEGVVAVERRLVSAAQPVDLLVNNAGFGTNGPFTELALDRELEMVGLNVVALMRLTRAGLKAMGHRGGGAIVNVSSMAGFQALPLTATYAASKAFVTSFTEALAEEARGSGVRLQALCPGLTRTEFHDSASWNLGWIPGIAWQSPERVVDASLAALERGQVVVVPGVLNKLTAATSWLLPRNLVTRLVSSSLRR